MSCSSGMSLQTHLRKHWPSLSGSGSPNIRNDSERERRIKQGTKSSTNQTWEEFLGQHKLNRPWSCNRDRWMEGGHELKAYKKVISNPGCWVPGETTRQEAWYKSSTFPLRCIIKLCHRKPHSRTQRWFLKRFKRMYVLQGHLNTSCLDTAHQGP